MSTKELLEASLFLQIGLNVGVFSAIAYRKGHRVFPQLSLMLLVEFCSVSVTLALLFFRKPLHVSFDRAYAGYFWTAWISCGLSLIFRILAVYAVFAEAMRPLSGLHEAGKMIFRWVGLVSALVAFALLAGPGVFSSLGALTTVFSRLQQGVSVLTLCLLVFVCFAIRPLGLTFRSHLFGVSLGLGIAATVDLVEAAWQVTHAARSVYSPIYLVTSLGFCIALLVWGVYFAAPEPARKMILLPTTSPFFFWNRISEILGDSPGHVAVAGFTPDMLAPAEIEMLTTATAGEASRRAEQAAPIPARLDAPRRAELGSTPRPSLAL